MEEKYKTKGGHPMHDIYPCDLDPMGECPKRCQDCGNCRGWFYHLDPEEGEEEE